ncbi:MAG: methylenetetrahydrofolate dehydrogenase [Candidatus Altiarchaeales archaeon HGW-Altiarchaeales-3]|nr:MAG: methylenetetrahydrofolate dehydrogenase [Candidatus Altiarchaeales archaeon HGW-Altiarchaeales-3]
MKKILIYLSMEKYASPFDLIEAYDSDVDDLVVVPYTGVEIDDVPGLINDTIFPRHPKDLINTAVFIGGHDVVKGDEMMDIAVKQMFEPFKISIVADTDGSNTTATGTVVKIKEAIENKGGSLKGKKAIIFAGTGPVGLRIAALLIKEGAQVAVTSRRMDGATAAVEKVKKVYHADITPYEVRSDEDTVNALKDFNPNIIVTTGPPKICILKKETWERFDDIEVMADVNAYPPYGVEGVDANDNCKEIEGSGKFGIGALRIGTVKNDVQKKVVKKLFEKKGQIIELEDIYNAAFE